MFDRDPGAARVKPSHAKNLRAQILNSGCLLGACLCKALGEAQESKGLRFLGGFCDGGLLVQAMKSM